MRKFVLVVFMLVLAVSVGYCSGIYVDGKRVTLKALPVIKKGVLFVPMRGIFEVLGAKVSYYKAKKQVVAAKGNKKIVLTLGSNVAKINGFSHKLFMAPFQRKGRTYIPLRFVSEALGCKVNWHPPTKTVNIYTKLGKEKNPFSDMEGVEKDEWGKPIKADFKKIEKIKPIEPIKK